MLRPSEVAGQGKALTRDEIRRRGSRFGRGRNPRRRGPPRTDPGERNYRTGLLPRVLTRKRTVPLAVSSPALVTSFPGPVSGGWFALEDSPWAGPFPPATPPTVPQHHLCFAAFFGTTDLSDCRGPFITALLLGFAVPTTLLCAASPRLSRFPLSKLPCMPRSPTAQRPDGSSSLRPVRFCLPHISRRSALQTLPNFRGLNHPACIFPCQRLQHTLSDIPP